MRRFLQIKREGEPSRPFRLFQVEPTMNCNLRCVMRPWLAHHSPDKVMSWETFERIARYFPRTQEVDLSGGGDSLLHPRLLEMIERAKAAGCTVGFSTNATLLHPQTSRALIEVRLDWIAFPLDAAAAATYENIRLLQEAKAAFHRATPETLSIFTMMRTILMNCQPS